MLNYLYKRGLNKYTAYYTGYRSCIETDFKTTKIELLLIQSYTLVLILLALANNNLIGPVSSIDFSLQFC